MRFYLGTHEVSWLARDDVARADSRLFVSHRRLARRRALPRARVAWALDSGGFTELSMYGRWETTSGAYVTAVHRYRDQVGRLEWVAPMDWMCEPWILAKTGLTEDEHQRRTVGSYLDLRAHIPEVVPVIQGADLAGYMRCVDLYDRAGIDLTRHRTVGIGSVCRRQHTGEIAAIVRALHDLGIRLHGFGVKTLGLSAYAHQLGSADSLAWSYRARMAARDGAGHPGCKHRTCANCPRYALRWRERLLASLNCRQLDLWEAT